MILISACLAGLEVRYDGTHCKNEALLDLIKTNNVMTVCPEVLGGLLTPREPAEIVGGDGQAVLDGTAKVISKTGQDVTDNFIKGAYATLKRAQELNVSMIILKENSPSCGSSMIYDGTFSGSKVVGNGVTAALLRRNGIKVFSEENYANTEKS